MTPYTVVTFFQNPGLSFPGSYNPAQLADPAKPSTPHAFSCGPHRVQPVSRSLEIKSHLFCETFPTHPHLKSTEASLPETQNIQKQSSKDNLLPHFPTFA